MESHEGYKDIAARMLSSLKRYNAFIFQRGIDDPARVMEFINSSGLMRLLNVVNLDNKIFVVRINDKSCQVECRYKECKNAEDAEECISNCIASCRLRLLKKLVEHLENYIGS